MQPKLIKEIEFISQKPSENWIFGKIGNFLTLFGQKTPSFEFSHGDFIHGVPEKPKESPDQCKTEFVKNVQQHLDIQLNNSYIKRAHRIGKKKENGKPRPIIVRLYDPELRNLIYINKKKCKGSKISITESLTKRRMEIKSSAEQQYGPNNVWTKEGRIYAKDNNDVIKTIIV